SGGSGFPVTVAYTTADVPNASFKATAGVDYSVTSGTLTFLPGETSKSIVVPILSDTLNEFNEVFAVNLSNPTRATISTGSANGTIFDDDPAPSLSINDATVTEGDTGTTNAVFTITLSGPSGKTIGVSFSAGAAGDTATSGVDYSLSPGGVSFMPGETTKTITVAVKGDLIDEDDEQFSINL